MASRSSRCSRSAAQVASSRSPLWCSASTAASSAALARDQPAPPGPSTTRSDVVAVDAGPPAQMDVVLELVGAVAQVGHAEDHQLGLAPGQRAAGHQPAGEAQPAPEQAAVAAEGQEQVRRAPCPSARPATSAKTQATEPTSRRRPGAMRAPLSGRAPAAAWSADASPRGERPSASEPALAAASTTGWTAIRTGSTGPTHARRHDRRERRAMPRSRASMPDLQRRHGDARRRCIFGAASVPKPGWSCRCPARRSRRRRPGRRWGELHPQGVAQRLDGGLRRAIGAQQRDVDGGGQRGDGAGRSRPGG